MRILYLYAEVMGYTIATVRALADRGVEVHIVHWDHRKLTPYKPLAIPGVYMYKRSELTVGEMLNLAKKISPTLIVVSGWQDQGYMTVAKLLKKPGTHIVVGVDTQWRARGRQRIAVLLGQLGYFSRHFSHAWVAGAYQFEYMRRLGFESNRIIFDLYSADTKLFHDSYRKYLEVKNESYPHRFLFLGRLEPTKGVDELIQAWESLDGNRKDWELHMVGNGSMMDRLSSNSGIFAHEFKQPEELVKFFATIGCMVLPSRAEPWGVVVHEAAAAGLPLLVSDVVGAASTFLISGANGYRFKSNDASDLASSLSRIIALSDEDLRRMAELSFKLSYRISPETSAENLLSII